jgi:hypothetical protein
MPLTPPLCIRVTYITVLPTPGYTNRWTTTMNIDAPQGYGTGEYNGLNISAGQWTSNAINGYTWRIDQVVIASDTTVVVILEDVDNYNAIIDPSQGIDGGAPGEGFFGYIFELNSAGLPILYLVNNPPSITWTDSQLSRFLITFSVPSSGGPTGPQGIPGATGHIGIQGPTGDQGPQGLPGQASETGATGPSGSEGPTGHIGPTGLPGEAANTGATGSTGEVGPTGPTGAQGIPGTSSNTGATGPTGIQGPTGEQGIPGSATNTGATGAQGFVGPTGFTGQQGSIGPTGSTGYTGLKGDTGIQGRTGSTGGRGFTGFTGPIGPTGIQGAKGGDNYYSATDIAITPDPSIGGYQTINVGTHLSYTSNQKVIVTSTNDPTKYYEGRVGTYDPTTGDITIIQITSTTPPYPLDVYDININGGANGATGPTGPTLLLAIQFDGGNAESFYAYGPVFDCGQAN